MDIRPNYSKDRRTAFDAQYLAQFIALSPFVFQVTRQMLDRGIFEYLYRYPDGVPIGRLIEEFPLSPYAMQVLLESSLTAGTILLCDEKYFLSKVGWFLLHDPSVRVNIDFSADVNYLGLSHLGEALERGTPSGLKELGDWPTIYEGLKELPADVADSWFGFDHFYSDNSFDDALKEIFDYPVEKILDVGGNTGKWAEKCVEYDPRVEVTVLDLPGQVQLMKERISGHPAEYRVKGIPCNILKEIPHFEATFDVVWMSQFLDCFSEPEVITILKNLHPSLDEDSRLFIMETCWDRQKYDTAAFCIAQTSVYFTTMANGNSKMFLSDDLFRMIEDVGLEIVRITDGIGWGHTLIECKKS